MPKSNKQIIFSGVAPSGNIHLGNYLGAIKNWVELQNKYDCIFCIVDHHAITVPQKPKILHTKILEVAKIYLACGIDPEKSTIFIQSQVKEHTELAWILSTLTKVPEMQKMTQYKDKVAKKKSQNIALLSYPILMAADILLYDTNLVPVGADQTQHLEFARLIANRFNQVFGETFVIPEQYTLEISARIMGLDDPTKKMSKSAESPYNYIALADSPDIIRKKFAKAVTDSGKEIKYSQDKPAIMNLMNIYQALTGDSIQKIEKKYKGKGYSDFKRDLGEIVVEYLKPIQTKLAKLEADPKYVEKILKDGAARASKIAAEKMTEVYEKIGYVNF